jgi:hypothetical protein
VRFFGKSPFCDTELAVVERDAVVTYPAVFRSPSRLKGKEIVTNIKISQFALKNLN